MSSETYYLIAAICTVLGLLSGVVMYFLRRADATDRRMTNLVIERNTMIETQRARADAGFAQSSQRYAELSERITREKLENLRELKEYMTRPEADRRFDQHENYYRVLNEKLDAILHAMAGIKNWPMGGQ